MTKKKKSKLDLKVECTLLIMNNEITKAVLVKDRSHEQKMLFG